MTTASNITLLNFLLSTGDENGHGATTESFSINHFIMHHVKDEVIYPLHIFNFDISITKHVLMIWIAALILMISLPLLLRSKKIIPTGPANFIEWITIFLKESVIDPNLGKHGYQFAPYLLTAFFFILTCNLIGLVPMGSTATGNISITATLALITLLTVLLSNILQNGFKGFIKSFIPPGLPVVMVPLIFAIEVLGLLTKHLALAVRLFANMFAGHLVIFSIMGLIFIFKNLLISPFPIFMIVFISLLEILISIIQAYIFTVLSAVFIGMAVNHHH